jgi:hypothetical protein
MHNHRHAQADNRQAALTAAAACRSLPDLFVFSLMPISSSKSSIGPACAIDARLPSPSLASSIAVFTLRRPVLIRIFDGDWGCRCHRIRQSQAYSCLICSLQQNAKRHRGRRDWRYLPLRSPFGCSVKAARKAKVPKVR